MDLKCLQNNFGKYVKRSKWISIFVEGKVTWSHVRSQTEQDMYLIYTDNSFGKYQLPQTAYTCAFTIHFALTLFQNLITKEKLFIAKILKLMEVTSHLSVHVFLHNITTWDSNNPYAGQSPGQCILLNILWLVYCTQPCWRSSSCQLGRRGPL